MKKIIETKKLDTDKIKVWELKFDKEVYKKDVLEAIIEDKAKETEEKLRKEKEEKEKLRLIRIEKKNKVVEDGVFNLHSKNINKQSLSSLLEYFDFSKKGKDYDKNKIRLYKKVFYILTEIAQNVIKNQYFIKDDKTISKENTKEYKKYENSDIEITWDGNEIIISTSNYIKNGENMAKKIENTINLVNWMEQEELNIAYKKQLTEWTLSEKWWAWLWFIDMRRKSNNWFFKYHYLNEDKNEDKFQKLNISIHIPINEKNELRTEKIIKNNQKVEIM